MEDEPVEPVNPPPGAAPNQVTQFKAWCQSNRWIAPVIIIGIIVIAAGKFTDAWDKIHKFFAHSQLELLDANGNPLANHEIFAASEIPETRPGGQLRSALIIRNKGNLPTGKMTVKLYANDPLPLEDRSSDESSYKYEQIYTPEVLHPSEIAAHLSTPFYFQTYGIPPSGKYRCLLKFLSENGKQVQAEFWLVVTNGFVPPPPTPLAIWNLHPSHDNQRISDEVKWPYVDKSHVRFEILNVSDAVDLSKVKLCLRETQRFVQDEVRSDTFGDGTTVLVNGPSRGGNQSFYVAVVDLPGGTAEFLRKYPTARVQAYKANQSP
jgi:hypothetical protein